MPTGLDEITHPPVAYLRLDGRDAGAYTTGKTVADRKVIVSFTEEVEDVQPSDLLVSLIVSYSPTTVKRELAGHTGIPFAFLW